MSQYRIMKSWEFISTTLNEIITGHYEQLKFRCTSVVELKCVAEAIHLLLQCAQLIVLRLRGYLLRES